MLPRLVVQEGCPSEPKTSTSEGKSLPKPVQDFIRAIEEGGTFGDCGGGPPYCEVDAEICENLCQFLVKHFEN